MNFTKKIVALIVACAMLCTFFAFVGCHKKDEVVVSVKLGETQYDITSGLYLALQFDAFQNFYTDLNSDLSSAGAAVSNIFDVLSGDYTVSGKNSTDWINDKTLSLVKQYAATLYLFDQMGLEMTSEDNSSVDQYVSYYWDQGYKNVYEKNGISKASYKKVIEYNTKKGKLFSFYYDAKTEQKSTTGKKSDKIVPESEITGAINNKFILADSLSISTVSTETDSSGNKVEYTEAQLNSFKTKLEGYASRINAGTAFATIKSEYDAESGTKAEDNSTDTTTAQAQDSDTPKSIYPESAKILSESDQDPAEYKRFKTLKDTEGKNFAYGKAYVITSETGAYYLAVLYDLSKDEHYLTEKRSDILSELKQDDFEKMLEETVPEGAMTVNQSLVSYYKPTNIEAPDSTSK